MGFGNEKYGQSSWNAGLILTPQDGVPEGFKRCSKIVDDRCKEAHGIHPLKRYRKRSSDGTKRLAQCRWCESYERYQRSLRPERIDEYRRYQREYRRVRPKGQWMLAINSKPVRVLYDPDGIFRPGAEFSKHDFNESLDGGVWPRGMEVMDVETGRVFIVLGTRLVPKEDE